MTYDTTTKSSTASAAGEVLADLAQMEARLLALFAQAITSSQQKLEPLRSR